MWDGMAVASEYVNVACRCSVLEKVKGNFTLLLYTGWRAEFLGSSPNMPRPGCLSETPPNTLIYRQAFFNN